jgi:hypothetical protein
MVKLIYPDLNIRFDMCIAYLRLTILLVVCDAVIQSYGETTDVIWMVIASIIRCALHH